MTTNTPNARQAVRCGTILANIDTATDHANGWLDAIQKAQEVTVWDGGRIALELSRAEHNLMQAQASLSVAALLTRRHMKALAPNAQNA